MKSAVVERLTFDSISIEFFSDGDCVIHADRPGYIQLSADVFSRYHKSIPNSSNEKQNGKSKQLAFVNNKAEQIEISSEQIDQTKYSRSITNIGEGWECLFRRPGFPEIRHVYQFRSHARASKIDTSIGQNGRIE